MRGEIKGTVTVEELKAKLEQNRGRHRKAFEKALVDYRDFAIRQLDEQIERLKKGGNAAVYVNVQAPEDHTDDYDRVLAMRGMTVDDVMQIEESLFQCYVMDQWEWNEQFVATNSSYLQ